MLQMVKLSENTDISSDAYLDRRYFRRNIKAKLQVIKVLFKLR